jgi:hypothetical protein
MTIQEDLDGSPALVKREYIHIKFQLGPVKEVGVNGCQIEDVLDILIARMDGFQKGPFACEINDAVLLDLHRAKQALHLRTADRKNRGVEGKNVP